MPDLIGDGWTVAGVNIGLGALEILIFVGAETLSTGSGVFGAATLAAMGGLRSADASVCTAGDMSARTGSGSSGSEFSVPLSIFRFYSALLRAS
jgi:hypothetical protein